MKIFKLHRQLIFHQDFHSVFLGSIDDFISQSFYLYLLVIMVKEELSFLPYFFFYISVSGFLFYSMGYKVL